MTEKEKSSLGLLYGASDELTKERLEVRKLLFEFNNLFPDKVEAGMAIIRRLFKRTGASFTVEQPFRCEYGYNIEIGENFYSNYNFIVLDNARVVIGDNVLIAPNVGIYTAGHPLDIKPRNEGLEYAYPITIGDNVWLCAGVQVLPGVTIGANSVIGAGSIVNKDIPEGVLAAGNPCRVVRKIT